MTHEDGFTKGSAPAWMAANPVDAEARNRYAFEDEVRTILDNAGDLLVEKNKAYGNSALDPVRVFSRASTVEQLNVRIDDKLSRLARGHEYPGDDTIRDLIGYLVLLLRAKEIGE